MNRPVEPPAHRSVALDRPVLLYDADCRFCRFSLRLIAAWDRRRRLAIVSFQDPLGAALALRVPQPERFTAFHLIAPGRPALSGREALGALLAELPGGHLARAAGLHRLYGPIAARRGRIGGLLPDLAPVRRPPGASGGSDG